MLQFVFLFQHPKYEEACLSIDIQEYKNVLLHEEYFQIRSNFHSEHVLRYYLRFLRYVSLKFLNKIDTRMNRSKIIKT